MDYIQLEVYRFGPWVWQVHENQSYLGRLIFRLDRHETGSLSRCKPDEWESLHGSIWAYEDLLNQLFAPDRFNYSQMGNVFSQLHVQAVPRYKANREWRDKVFSDRKWGKNWAPTPHSPLTVEETYDFASWFREELRKRAKRSD